MNHFIDLEHFVEDIILKRLIHFNREKVWEYSFENTVKIWSEKSEKILDEAFQNASYLMASVTESSVCRIDRFPCLQDL